MNKYLGTGGKKLVILALSCAALLGMLGYLAPSQAAAATYLPDLYQLHSDGSIWQYNGGGLYSWTRIGTPNANIADIAARGIYLYQLDKDGSIWQYVRSSQTWTQIDSNPATSKIAVGGNGHLYQMHTTGSIWQYNGGGMTGWQELDDNSLTTDIEAGGSALYQIHKDHTIWQYAGGGFHSWTLLDNNIASSSIKVSDNGTLYQAHGDTSVWRYDGGGLYSWTEMLSGSLYERIDAGGNTLYVVHGYDNPTLLANTTGDPASWVTIDDSAKVGYTMADGYRLYEVRSDTSIWQYNGAPDSWTELDNNPQTLHIAWSTGTNIYAGQ